MIVFTPSARLAHAVAKAARKRDRQERGRLWRVFGIDPPPQAPARIVFSEDSP